MGLSNRHRGFSDENLFMAMTSQPKIAGMDLNDCQYARGKRVCKLYSQKWTYAIPLEIIYLTPLSSWNPYDIQFKGLSNSKAGREVTEGMKQDVGLRQTGMRMDDLRFRLNFNLSKNNEQLLYYVRELVTKLVTNFRT